MVLKLVTMEVTVVNLMMKYWFLGTALYIVYLLYEFKFCFCRLANTSAMLYDKLVIESDEYVILFLLTVIVLQTILSVI